MAIAIFHSIRGEKKTTALVLVKRNAFVFTSDPAYIPANALPKEIKQGESFEIPDGYQLVDFVVNGETRHTKEGVALKTLSY